jgi:hypothetical protein
MPRILENELLVFELLEFKLLVFAEQPAPKTTVPAQMADSSTAVSFFMMSPVKLNQ